MSKTLIVAEKPSVARDIARVLGVKGRGEGCIVGEEYIVTWAIGHLVSLCEPGEVDARWVKWSMAQLPMLPDSIPLPASDANPASDDPSAKAPFSGALTALRKLPPARSSLKVPISWTPRST